ncbi:unknown [Clostridium sp. CAG:452]|nr:unknown [Clostridium sp. CAG:452]
MIIVSQDKEKIVNFDNMTRVYITFDEGDDDVCIRTETVDSLYEDLGYYKTEERAKEVLAEIIKSYRDYRTAECDGYTDSCNKFVLQETAVFEMPED